ncbi:5'-3' deoxyribonucleotidase [Spironucleus salmonicida]|uniref:5'-3' deoxyribonucleotidase n=1 Tax=Spironucleus salmonicida TaxID=348837 RepID=V6M0K3_9EUKA|nr:5'-3' deoxyribonucleotidase [Spironucleus salmonicida]|eukprot:EST46654.1 5'-3' deoxyribonucleotidase [Spironucleus salmonicida]
MIQNKQISTESSILVDMDGTLYDTQFETKFHEIYPNIKLTQYPYILHIAETSMLAACKARKIIFDPQFFLDETPYQHMHSQIKKFTNEQKDVFICTQPVQTYTAPLAEFLKVAQILNSFGYQQSTKIYFGADKTVFKGKYLIDDHPDFTEQEARATWKQIMVNQEYNSKKTNSRRIGTESVEADIKQIFMIDNM